MRLALDLSTTATGWALGPGDKPTEWGTIKPRPRATLPDRFFHITEELLAINESLGPFSEVYCEELHYLRGMPAVRALAGLRGVVIYAMHKQLSVPVYFRHQKQGYNAIGLKGNATKDEVVRRVRALGYAVANDNEADAIAVFYGSLRG